MMSSRCKMLSRGCAGAALLAALSLSSLALADGADTATRNAARELGTSGVEAYQSGRYEQASDELEKAYSILRVPSLGLWSARALVKRGRLLEAVSRYQETIALRLPSGDVEVHKKAIQDAKSELATLEPTLPTLTIHVTGASPSEAQVTLDGEPLPTASLETPLRLNPGVHRLVGLHGNERVSASETLSEGQHSERALGFRASQATPPSAPSLPSPPAATVPDTSGVDSSDATLRPSHAPRLWSVVALAAGGAGLGFGGVTGLLAMSKRGQLDDTGKCTDGCPSSLRADVDELNAYRTLSSVGFIAGGVLAATGIVLWVTAPSEQRQARARITPGGVLFEGSF